MLDEKPITYIKSTYKLDLLRKKKKYKEEM